MLKSIVDNIDDKENIFPIELNKEFKIFKVKFNELTKIQEGDKIGKDKDGNYILFSRGWVMGYSQTAWRKLYREDRNNSNKYLEEDFTKFAKFLDRINTVADSDLLNVYKTFSYDVSNYCQKLISSLYNLKKTYDDGADNSTEIIARIDSIILVLIEYKEKIETVYVSKHKGNFSCYLNMDSKLQ